MTTRLLALAALGGLLTLLSAGHAQDRKTTKDPTTESRPATKSQRSVYAVRGGDPVILAEVIAKHFKGELEVSVLPSALVLSGQPAAITEATKLLDQIDRQPRTVEIEVTLIEVATKADTPLPLVGTDVLARLDELSKQGAGVQRIRLAAVEDQPVSVQASRNQPYTSSTAILGGRGGPGGGGVPGGGPGGGGPVVQRSVTYHQIGTTVKAAARVGPDDVVAIDLNVQDSGVKLPEPADESAGGAATFDTATLTTRVRVPPGQAVLAQATRKDLKGARTVTLVIVSAKVIEPGAKAAR